MRTYPAAVPSPGETERVTSNLGGLGGFILQAAIPSMVNGSGQPNLGVSPADDLAIRALAGFITGGLLVLIFSVVRFAKNEHFNNK